MAVRVLRVIAIGVLGLVACLGAVAFGARFHDGPLGPFAGGPLEAGAWVDGPEPDWAQWADVREIELQLLAPPRSRTTWLLVRDGVPYVPCGFVDVPIWKRWPHEAERDGRAVVRIDGHLVERRAVRVTDPALVGELSAQLSAKYGVAVPGDRESVWFFRLDPRTGS